MLVLLFPNVFLDGDDLFSLLPIINGAGDREIVLRSVGQNNYRTNLLESIICDLGNRARYVKLLWKYVNMKIMGYEERMGYGLWNITQGDLIYVRYCCRTKNCC